MGALSWAVLASLALAAVHSAGLGLGLGAGRRGSYLASPSDKGQQRRLYGRGVESSGSSSGGGRPGRATQQQQPKASLQRAGHEQDGLQAELLHLGPVFTCAWPEGDEEEDGRMMREGSSSTSEGKASSIAQQQEAELRAAYEVLMGVLEEAEAHAAAQHKLMATAVTLVQREQPPLQQQQQQPFIGLPAAQPTAAQSNRSPHLTSDRALPGDDGDGGVMMIMMMGADGVGKQGQELQESAPVLPAGWLPPELHQHLLEVNLDWLDIAMESVWEQRYERVQQQEAAAQQQAAAAAAVAADLLTTTTTNMLNGGAMEGAMGPLNFASDAGSGSSSNSSSSSGGGISSSDGSSGDVAGGGESSGSGSGRANRRLAQISGTALNAVSGVIQRNIAFNCSTLSGLEACAEALCADVFSLVRTASGRVECRLTTPQTNGTATQTVIVAPYAYSYFFEFSQNVALFGFSAGIDNQYVNRYRTREPSGNDFYNYYVTTFSARATQGSFRGIDISYVESRDTPFISFGVNTVQPFTYNTRFSPTTLINVLQLRGVIPGYTTNLLSVLTSAQYTVFGNTGLPWLP